MELWQLTPVAEVDDPRWLGRRPVKKVLVAAETAGQARIVANRATVAAGESGGTGNESGPARTAFMDEKLYRLDRISDPDRSLPSTPQILSIDG